MKRVLVTGHSGFIGSHLVTELGAAGYDVVGLDKRLPEHPMPAGAGHTVDLLDRGRLIDKVRQVQPDVVVHLAARTDLLSRTVADYEANTIGVANLAKAVAATSSVERVLVTSSQLVCRPGYVPASDTDYAPDTAYGASKVQGEQLWRDGDGAGRAWCILRPTTIWGPRMNPHYLRFFRMIRSGRYFHVGNKPILKSYGYVQNTTRQIRCLIEAPTQTIHRRMFYVADEPIDLSAWAEAFRKSLSAPPIRRLPFPLARTAARVGDFVSALGWRSFPFTSFRLRNVMVESVVDTAPLLAVCGSQPYTMSAGVARTVEWLESLWSDRSPIGAPAALSTREPRTL